MAAMNTSAEIRTILTESPTLNEAGVRDVLRQKFPGRQLNPKTVSVTVSAARKKLGITAPKFANGKAVPETTAYALTVVTEPVTLKPEVDFKLLSGAAKLIREVGSPETAAEAIRQVQALQV